MTLDKTQCEESVKLILVGGFLGSGKTTTLFHCARDLAAQGVKVGLITNDQAPDLVDTYLLSDGGFAVREVAGSCFCCNFPGFTDAIEDLIGQGAKVILAEPVGSCTDLVSTIIQPLKRQYPKLSVAPLTVLVDPAILPEIIELKPSDMDPDALYILDRQLSEADWIAVSKSDVLSETQRDNYQNKLSARWGGKPLFFISSLANPASGLQEWLTKIQSASAATAGSSRIDVNYDRYAHGEAVLAWLNCSADISDLLVSEEDYLRRLITDLQSELQSNRWPVGHIKAALFQNGRAAYANLTALNSPVQSRTELLSSSQPQQLILNARVQTAPEKLESLVRETIQNLSATPSASSQMQTEKGVEGNCIGRLTIKELRCFQPGRPNPTFRTAHKDYLD